MIVNLAAVPLLVRWLVERALRRLCHFKRTKYPPVPPEPPSPPGPPPAA